MFKNGDIVTRDYVSFFKLEGPIKDNILTRNSKKHYIIYQFDDGILLNILRKGVKVSEETAFATFKNSYILNDSMVKYIKYFAMQEKLKDIREGRFNQSVNARVTNKVKSILNIK